MIFKNLCKQKQISDLQFAIKHQKASKRSLSIGNLEEIDYSSKLAELESEIKNTIFNTQEEKKQTLLLDCMKERQRAMIVKNI